jgi:IS605 OrfB family transposase
MSYLTVVAQVKVGGMESAGLLAAMRCATKVYNGLLGELRQAYEQTGQSSVSRKNLHRILKALPRARGYYSLSVQATRDEVIGAYRSYFGLRSKGHPEARQPGFRRKTSYSGLRYLDGYGIKLEGDRLRLGLGLKRAEGVRPVTVQLQHRPGVEYRKVVHVPMTYDEKNGMAAHLVVDVEDGQAKGSRKATVENRPKSKRLRQIEQQESRQVNQLLHLLTKNFVARCYQAGVDTIAIADLTHLRQNIDYGEHLNQRLHAWPFAQIARRIAYKARLAGIQVIQIREAYSSQTCHACAKVARSNRKTRGHYPCSCGWHAHADLNASANIFQSAFNGSPIQRSSGEVASPAVLSLITHRHTVCTA